MNVIFIFFESSFVNISKNSLQILLIYLAKIFCLTNEECSLSNFYIGVN